MVDCMWRASVRQRQKRLRSPLSIPSTARLLPGMPSAISANKFADPTHRWRWRTCLWFNLRDAHRSNQSCGGESSSTKIEIEIEMDQTGGRTGPARIESDKPLVCCEVLFLRLFGQESMFWFAWEFDGDGNKNDPLWNLLWWPTMNGGKHRFKLSRDL